VLNGSSGYGNSNGTSVTGAEKPGPLPSWGWLFPVVVWRP
jgi:hypothetical protein